MTKIEQIRTKLEMGESLTPDEGWVLYYAMVDARREGAEEMRRKMWQQQIDDNANIAAGHAAGVFPG